MTNAANITWGIELETTIKGTANVEIGGYHRGIQVPGMGGWKAESDSSIRALVVGRRGCEFVSPKLKGQAGLDSLAHAVGMIKGFGGRVNHTCGVHVTVEFNGDAGALARLITLVANYEKALYASTGTTTRENPVGRSDSWCKGLKRYGDHQAAKARGDDDRYHLLNLTHLAAGRNRVEFRVFSGSLNLAKLVAWVQIAVGLVELALTTSRRTKWTTDASKGPWAKNGRGTREGGEGAIEMRRLFYRLGWTKGHTTYEAGLVGEGMDLAAAKKTMLAMAAKYDAA